MTRCSNRLKVVVLFLISSTAVYSGNEKTLFHRDLKWLPPQSAKIDESKSLLLPYFEGAFFNLQTSSLPYYAENVLLGAGKMDGKVSMLNPRFEPCTDAVVLANKRQLKTVVEVESFYEIKSKVSYLRYNITPFRINPIGGQVERLVSFDLSVEPVLSERYSNSNDRIYLPNSVLATGNWFRVGVTTDGIYKITKKLLKELGADVDSLNLNNLRVYGNGGAMLPYANSIPRPDDLLENAIRVVDKNNNGLMDDVDYALFYGQGTTRWNYDTVKHRFNHIPNDYSDTSYYFITTDLGPGKRIMDRLSSTFTPNKIVNTFNDYVAHELDLENMLISGRIWYGEVFDILNTYDISFVFPNIDASVPVSINTDVAGRWISSTGNSYFYFKVNGNLILTDAVPYMTGADFSDYAYTAGGDTLFNAPSSNFVVNVTYSHPDNAIGWLNYMELNARRNLTMSGNSMLFRDVNSVGLGNVSKFNLTVPANSTEVWDVSDPTNVLNQQMEVNSGVSSFILSTDNLHEFISFQAAGAHEPAKFGRVPNQNLHSVVQSDMVIVCPAKFKTEADRLAKFHRDHDSLSVVVVSPQEIYNEFSSGKEDVTAIRSFVKMLYDRNSDATKLPQSLLLFGDGSYDNKHRISENNNFIPTFQSLNSLRPTSSYVSDDFFGLLDDSEGTYDDGNDHGIPDLGIGRFPVSALDQARAMVDKVIHYSTEPGFIETAQSCPSNTCSVFGDWRNEICFVADDGDVDTHISNAESLAAQVGAAYKSYNIDKIYFDAYKMDATPGGDRYPDVRDAINKRVEKGALIINYTGHGGEAGWAHERVLEISDINEWTNYCKLTTFFTATCEFSRYDNPHVLSAGELALLNQHGGAIILLSTVRLVYSGPNFNLNQKFYNHVFSMVNGKRPNIGTVMQATKFDLGFDTNDRNFTLLGDPAVKLAYPKLDVKTTMINSHLVSSTPDTIRALQKVTIQGFVADGSGNKITSFNGVVSPTVFDKASVITTLANKSQNVSPAMNFNLMKNVVYHGKAKVVNGDFSFTFVVPKDIGFTYGSGKVSYYAQNGTIDASGDDDQVIVGGIDTTAKLDAKGPDIKLYMNDEHFVFGGLTDASPSIYAVVNDSSGVNTVGTGIGHDITAQVDDDKNLFYVLNDYYEADLDNYQRGKVIYKLGPLPPGRHTLTFKVWDVYNNSSSAYLEFTVSESAVLTLDHVMNYPNPFSTHTSFYFEHNRSCVPMQVQIQVFTVSGKIVKTLNTTVFCEGYRPSPIEWDGLDDYNDRLGMGVYFYKLKVRTNDGATAEKFEKLVILR